MDSFIYPLRLKDVDWNSEPSCLLTRIHLEYPFVFDTNVRLHQKQEQSSVATEATATATDTATDSAVSPLCDATTNYLDPDSFEAAFPRASFAQIRYESHYVLIMHTVRRIMFLSKTMQQTKQQEQQTSGAATSMAISQQETGSGAAMAAMDSADKKKHNFSPNSISFSNISLNSLRYMLLLTNYAILLNSADYSSWALRRSILFSPAWDDHARYATQKLSDKDKEHQRKNLGAGKRKYLTAIHQITADNRVEIEIQYINFLLAKLSKNYQIWQHRRLLVSHVASHIDSSGVDKLRALLHSELNIVDLVFQSSDDKNYHAWSHRQWVWKFFNGLTTPGQGKRQMEKSPQENEKGQQIHPVSWLSSMDWDNELSWTTARIDKDIRNNSAWNHRYFLHFQSGRTRWNQEQDQQGPLIALLKTEILQTLEWARLAVENESAWNYLLSLLSFFRIHGGNLELAYKLHLECMTFIKSIIEENENRDTCQGPRSAVFEVGLSLLNIHIVLKQMDPQNQSISAQTATSTIHLLQDVGEKLVILDETRRKFWQYRFASIPCNP